MFGIDVIDAGLLPAMLVALAAGVLSFLSPCVLPIVPPYLAYMGGISMGEMQAGRGAPRRRVMLPALFFVLGLSTVFLFLGFAASAFGAFFLQNAELVQHAGRRDRHGVRRAFRGRVPHRLSGPRHADGCGRPGRVGLRGLCAGPCLRLRLDALHRPATGCDPVAGGGRGEHGARHDAAWRSMRWGWASRSCWWRRSSRA